MPWAPSAGLRRLPFGSSFAFGRFSCRRTIRPLYALWLGYEIIVRGADLGILPQAKAAKKGVGVISHPRMGRKFLQELRVSAADDDLIGFEGCSQPLHHVFDVVAP